VYFVTEESYSVAHIVPVEIYIRNKAIKQYHRRFRVKSPTVSISSKATTYI
jgi:hypothetical protein